MLIVAIVVLFVGVIFVICYPYNKRKNARCTAQTQGMLLDVQRRFNSKGSLKSAHVYSYQVDGVDYQLKTLDYSPEVHAIGDSCTIWYNPDKPQDAQAYRGSDEYLKTLLIIGIALIVLGILLAIFGLVRLAVQ